MHVATSLSNLIGVLDVGMHWESDSTDGSHALASEQNLSL